MRRREEACFLGAWAILCFGLCLQTVFGLVVKTASPESDVSKHEIRDDKGKKDSDLRSEAKDVPDFMKIVFVKEHDDVLYITNVTFGGSDIGLRLDTSQPYLWVMGSSYFYSCEELNEWYDSEISKYGTNLPDSVTTRPEYDASVCAEYGLYGSNTTGAPTPITSTANSANTNIMSVPYIDDYTVYGSIHSDNVTLTNSAHMDIVLNDFSFVESFNSDTIAGGFGLAGLGSSSGFLNELYARGIIKGPGYSLWFDSECEDKECYAELLPGYVDKLYYLGDLYSFDIPRLQGFNYSEDDEQNIDKMTLPILPLNEIIIQNHENNKNASLWSPDTVTPVFLDARSRFLYLPSDFIINLALQANAFYSNDIGRWITECSALESVNASLGFIFGKQQIQVPLSKLLLNSSDEGYGNLKFSNGRSACFLGVLPNTSNGFISLGLPFLESIYFAMDIAGGKIAVAQAKPNILPDDYSISVKPKTTTTFTHLDLDSSTKNDSKHSATRENIISGTIPFATHINISSYSVFSYTSINRSASQSISIPPRLTGVAIKSGNVFVTQSNQLGSTILPGIASAASEASTSKKSTGRISHNFIFDTQISKTSTYISLVSLSCLVFILLM